jgi:hypothetical protein
MFYFRENISRQTRLLIKSYSVGDAFVLQPTVGDTFVLHPSVGDKVTARNREFSKLAFGKDLIYCM